MSKLTLHLQKVPDWLGEFVARCQGRLGYLVGVDVFPNFPGVQVLGRTYIPDGESNEYVNRGAVGANAWIDRFAPVYAANPHVAYWIGPNEYVLWDQAHVDLFNAFHVQYIERMSDLGHRVCCGQINTGWPRLRKYGDPPPYPETLAPTLGALWAHEGLFSLHEYWPGLDDPTGNILRYRDTRAALIAAGAVNLPDFVITELGIDQQTSDPGSDYGHWGWRHFVDWPGYFTMLKNYSAELAKDGYICASSIFTVADDWTTFQINRDEAMPLADWIAQDTPPVPPPPVERARGFMASKYQTTLNWEAIKRDGFEYVMLRVTGPNTPTDWTAIEVDPWLERHVAGAESVGLLKGGFHYLVPDLDGQAVVFANAAKWYTWDLPLFCDVEAAGLDRARVDRFLAAADLRLSEAGVVYPELGVYTNLNLWGKLGPWDRILWLAQWGVDEPSIDVWRFWQPAGAFVPDNEYVSLDVFNGTPEQLHSEYGNGEEQNPTMDIKVFDANGVERDWAWVVEQYGPLEVRLAEPWTMPDGSKKVLRLVKLEERFGPSTCIVKVLEEDGAPIVGINCAWHYSTAPMLPGGINPPTSLWEPNADYGPTNADGVVGFEISEDGTYYPDRNEAGPYGTWPFSTVMTSDGYFGVGNKAGTEHGHLNPTFQVVTVEDGEEPPTPPPPEDDSLARIAAAAERIAGSLEELVARQPVSYSATIVPSANVTWTGS